MTTDRMAYGYQPNFDIDREIGHQGEMFAMDVAKALIEGTAEVKTDERASETGNVFIEYACQRRGEWCPSGVECTAAELWVFILGHRQFLYAMPVYLLRKVCARARAAGMKTMCTRGSHPTKGIVIPLQMLMRWSIEEAGR